MADQQNTTWLIDYGLGGPTPVTHQVIASKPIYDERYYPAYFQLRNADGDVVALVPIAANPTLRRADTDPTLRPAAKTSASASASSSQVTFTTTQPSGAPSPAQLAALAQHAAKAARV